MKNVQIQAAVLTRTVPIFQIGSTLQRMFQEKEWVQTKNTKGKRSQAALSIEAFASLSTAAVSILVALVALS